jgi:quercetin dioxygenase-like cupin family protein
MNHIPHGSLAGDVRSHVFYGHEHGNVPISMFLVHNQPGDGPAPHRHPYAEVFVLHAGTARCRLDDNELLASSGDIVIAPAGAAHGFTNVGPGELRMTCVHTAAEMTTVWVERAAPRPATP